MTDERCTKLNQNELLEHSQGYEWPIPRVFTEVDTTMETIIEYGVTQEGVCVLTDFQRAGRGRKKRTWVAPADSCIMGSLFLYENKNSTLLFALSVVEVLNQYAKDYGVKDGFVLKWPNDVQYRGKKIAGILAEKAPKGIVVGFGINYCLPDDVAVLVNATSIQRVFQCSKNITCSPEKEKLVLDVLKNFQRKHQDNTSYIEQIKKNMTTIGAQVCVRYDNGEEIFGKACDLNEDGSLVVQSEARVRTIFSGDISHVQPL